MMPDLQTNTYSWQKEILLNQLRFTYPKPHNADKNLSHLSVQNLSDILSGKGNKTYNRSILGFNSQIQMSNFGERTQDLMYYLPHRTKLLNIAQSYIGKITEVTPEEYYKLPYDERNKTQMAIIGQYGETDDAWCAHTVSFMCAKAGIDIGYHKKGVQEFINWGQSKGWYRPIKTNTISSLNYLNERKQRAAQIRAQLKNIKEGDLIIWKSDTIQSTQIGLKSCTASHIGIIESVNEDGTVSVIEGNANEYKTGKYERYIATTTREAKTGNQQIGEAQEINPRDGIIRKVYTVEQLAAGGYSGYIDMQQIVK